MNRIDYNALREQIMQEVHQNPNKAFPQLHFERKKNGWQSRYHLNGERDSEGKYTTEFRDDKGSIVDYAREIKTPFDLMNPDYWKATTTLAEIYGIVIPKNDATREEFSQKEERQRALLKAQQAFSKAWEDTNDENVSATLTYLKSRGWTDEDIKAAQESGLIGVATKNALSTLAKDKYLKGLSNTYWGTSHVLTIALYGGSTLKGLKARTLGEVEDQIGKYINLAGTTLTESFWGIGYRTKEICLVEGELDALRARLKGIPNVVAMMGKNISEQMMKDAARKGVKSFTLIPDKDGEKKERQFVDMAIRTLQPYGFSVYVADLANNIPEGERVPKDVDEYLNTYTADSLKDVIRLADGAGVWQTRQAISDIEEKAKSLYDEDKCLSQKERKDFYDIVQSILITTPVYDHDLIFDLLDERLSGLKISKKAYLEHIEDKRKEDDERKQRESTLAALEDAKALAADGKAGAALDLLEGKISELKGMATEHRWESFLTTETPSSIRAALSIEQEGIPSGYIMGTKDGKENHPFVIPKGQLTIVAAPTNHGKSTMLRNLTLNIADTDGDGDILYFSLEESKEKVWQRLFNIYANTRLSINNNRTLNSHFAGNDSYVSRDVDLRALQTKEDTFCTDIVNKHIKVFYGLSDVTDLVELLSYYVEHRPIKAVLIDYIQLLDCKGTKGSQKDILRDACKLLMKCSVKTDIPIILGAQMGRQTKSPIDMSTKDISDAADIENAAHTIFAVWNMSKPMMSDNSYYKGGKAYIAKGSDGKTPEKDLTEEGKRMENKGYCPLSYNKLYATILKNRDGLSGTEAFLDFNGNTGHITKNAKEGQQANSDGNPEDGTDSISGSAPRARVFQG